MSSRGLKLQVVSRQRDGRCRYDEKAKTELIETALRSGASVARLALEHGVNANLLRKWIAKYLLKRESARGAQSEGNGLIPVRTQGVEPADGEVCAVVAVESSASAFVPVLTDAPAVTPESRPMAGKICLRACLPNGIELDLSQLDMGLLAEVVQTLGRLPCSGSTRI